MCLFNVQIAFRSFDKAFTLAGTAVIHSSAVFFAHAALEADIYKTYVADLVRGVTPYESAVFAVAEDVDEAEKDDDDKKSCDEAEDDKKDDKKVDEAEKDEDDKLAESLDTFVKANRHLFNA